LSDNADSSGQLEPLEDFTTNPAGAAIVNTTGPILQIDRIRIFGSGSRAGAGQGRLLPLVDVPQERDRRVYNPDKVLVMSPSDHGFPKWDVGYEFESAFLDLILEIPSVRIVNRREPRRAQCFKLLVGWPTGGRSSEAAGA
jgi:hypothetical protein